MVMFFELRRRNYLYKTNIIPDTHLNFYYFFPHFPGKTDVMGTNRCVLFTQGTIERTMSHYPHNPKGSILLSSECSIVNKVDK